MSEELEPKAAPNLACENEVLPAQGAAPPFDGKPGGPFPTSPLKTRRGSDLFQRIGLWTLVLSVAVQFALLGAKLTGVFGLGAEPWIARLGALLFVGAALVFALVGSANSRVFALPRPAKLVLIVLMLTFVANLGARSMALNGVLYAGALSLCCAQAVLSLKALGRAPRRLRPAFASQQEEKAAAPAKNAESRLPQAPRQSAGAKGKA